MYGALRDIVAFWSCEEQVVGEAGKWMQALGRRSRNTSGKNMHLFQFFVFLKYFSQRDFGQCGHKFEGADKQGLQ